MAVTIVVVVVLGIILAATAGDEEAPPETGTVLDDSQFMPTDAASTPVGQWVELRPAVSGGIDVQLGGYTKRDVAMPSGRHDLRPRYQLCLLL